jgi:hypothetical protein
MFYYVTDRDDSDEPAVLDYRKMAEPTFRHPLHDLVDRISLCAGLYLARHHLSHWIVADLASACNSNFAGECTKNVPFGENTNHLLIGVGDYHGTDLMLVNDLDRIAKANRRCNRNDPGTFMRQDSFDCH